MTGENYIEQLKIELDELRRQVADLVKEKQDTSMYRSINDPLTGLPNRILFKDRLNSAMAQARRNRQVLAVLLLGLDRFKVINDSLGHTMGDRLLQQTAARLSQLMRKSDTVARLEGDQFAVLAMDIGKDENAARVSQKILEIFIKPFIIGGHELHATASIGIATFPNDGEDAEALIINADTAMHRAKENGKNTYRLYTPEMNSKALQRLELENSIRRAMERGEFEVFYQPKVNIKTGIIGGFEALVRWRHRERGLVSPAEFIPLAEETGLIIPIGEWVLRTACEQNRQWMDAGYPPLRVAVNISARQFQQKNLVERVDQVLQETGLHPSWLELEITESLAMQDAEFTIKMLRDFKERGITISLDDFGTGYSSLNYLKRFPLNNLKIDQSFIRNITTDSDDEAIASAVIVLAQNMKLQVIAEGVETEEQLAMLRDRQCNEMQGYLFGKPVPADEFEKLLKIHFNQND